MFEKVVSENEAKKKNTGSEKTRLRAVFIFAVLRLACPGQSQSSGLPVPKVKSFSPFHCPLSPQPFLPLANSIALGMHAAMLKDF